MITTNNYIIPSLFLNVFIINNRYEGIKEKQKFDFNKSLILLTLFLGLEMISCTLNANEFL